MMQPGITRTIHGWRKYLVCGAGTLAYSGGMDKELSERIEKLESNLAHLEHQYDQLNQVVMEQARQLAKLQSGQQRISQTVEGMELERIKATNPKPPHYS